MYNLLMIFAVFHLSPSHQSGLSQMVGHV